MIAFGADPDLHNTGWAFVDSEGPSLLECGVVSLPAKFKGREAAAAMASKIYHLMLVFFEDCTVDRVVIEGQQVYLGDKKAGHPQDLIHLAHVSGALAVLARSICAEDVSILLPSEISAVPKHIRQSRAFSKLGIVHDVHRTKTGGWCVPNDLRGMTKGQWKHVGDAVAIALFAATKA